MAVQRCAVVPVSGGPVANVIMADADKDQPYKKTMFVPLADGERCDSRFEYWGEVAKGFRFRPRDEVEAAYYEEIRLQGEVAATVASAKSSKTTTEDIAASLGYVDGTPEKTAFDEGVAAAAMKANG